VEWIGEIPSHWEKVSLGKIGILYGGLTGKSGDDFRSGDHPLNKSFIPFTNISNNTYISKTHFQYVVIGDNENQNRVEKFDLFFLMSSEDYGDLGKSSILIEDVGELYLNSFCKGFRVKRDDVFPLFLNYQLLGDTHKKLISIEGNGFTRINLRQDRLKETPIFIPPLSEQNQIVSFLDTKTSLIDSLIEKTQRKIELLKEKRTSLINEVVTKGLNPNVEMKDSGVEWIGDIPRGWNRISLGKLGVLYGGLTGKSGDDFRSEDQTSNKPFIPFTNIFNNTYISKEHFQYVVIGEDENQNKVEKYDLFFLMSSEDYEDLGKSSILIEDVGEVYLNSFCKGFRVNNNDVFTIFLNYQLSGYTHKKLISIEGNGFTRINLRQDRLRETPVILPPLSEQKQIVEYLDEQTSKIDTSIKIEEKKIKLLKEYQQSLISSVVTGKIDVRTN
jgi:type I restriction enzyme S subunit